MVEFPQPTPRSSKVIRTHKHTLTERINTLTRNGRESLALRLCCAIVDLTPPLPPPFHTQDMGKQSKTQKTAEILSANLKRSTRVMRSVLTPRTGYRQQCIVNGRNTHVRRKVKQQTSTAPRPCPSSLRPSLPELPPWPSLDRRPAPAAFLPRERRSFPAPCRRSASSQPAALHPETRGHEAGTRRERGKETIKNVHFGVKIPVQTLVNVLPACDVGVIFDAVDVFPSCSPCLPVFFYFSFFFSWSFSISYSFSLSRSIQ